MDWWYMGELAFGITAIVALSARLGWVMALEYIRQSNKEMRPIKYEPFCFYVLDEWQFEWYQRQLKKEGKS